MTKRFAAIGGILTCLVSSVPALASDLESEQILMEYVSKELCQIGKCPPRSVTGTAIVESSWGMEAEVRLSAETRAIKRLFDTAITNAKNDCSDKARAVPCRNPIACEFDRVDEAFGEGNRALKAAEKAGRCRTEPARPQSEEAVDQFGQDFCEAVTDSGQEDFLAVCIETLIQAGNLSRHMAEITCQNTLDGADAWSFTVYLATCSASILAHCDCERVCKEKEADCSSSGAADF